MRGGGKRIWIGNHGYSSTFSDQAYFDAMPTTDHSTTQTIEYFTIEVSPADAVLFIESQMASKEEDNDWRAPINIDSTYGGAVIDFSAKYTDHEDDQEVTITVTAMNSSGKVVVSDTWSGKLSEKGENFRNGIWSDTL